MRFCPRCGKMLMPEDDMLKCICGYSENVSKEIREAEYKFKGDMGKANEVVVIDSDDLALPTKKITCYKCGGTKGYWWTVQTKSADEAPTYFIRCAKCGNTWRRSN